MGSYREGNAVLRAEGLVKRYGKRTVVNDVSINVKQGEIVGLLGPNGAGKTTSFYMTTGLVVPNAGHIFIDDQDITDYPVYKRARAGVGYLPQEASVFRKLSVEDNIMAVLEMTNTTRKYQQEKLESLIKEFRLEKVRKNSGDRLSGGERRRTEIARCLERARDALHYRPCLSALRGPNTLPGNARGVGGEPYREREVSRSRFQVVQEGFPAYRRRETQARAAGNRLKKQIFPPYII